MPTYALIQHLTDPLQSANQEVCAAISRAFLGDPAPGLSLDLYRQVALLEASDPEALYMATQSLDAPWTQVTPTIWHAERVRSTSVGDFIVDLTRGAVLLCAGIGWREMEADTAQKVQTLVTRTVPAQG